jgi:hypothetical protein
MGPVSTRAFHILLASFCALAMPVHGFAQQQPPAPNPPAPGAATTSAATVGFEDLSHEQGPFQLQNKKFTVVLHEKHIAGIPATDPEFQTTLVGIEIKDEKGVVHYRESFGYELNGTEFSETDSATAEVIEGRQRNGLLITYGSLPSTPLGGQSWQIFGTFNDKLVPFSKPIYAEGDLVDEAPGGTLKTSAEPNLQGEVIRFRIWTGNFFVIYPVRIDFILAKAMPAWRCFKMTSRGNLPLCPYQIETDRVPTDADLTFVRLFPEGGEEMGPPDHVVIKRDSKVEFLETEGEVKWEEDEHGVGLNPGDDFWLKVRIDGKEGWIHTQEDFSAVGLPQTG